MLTYSSHYTVCNEPGKECDNKKLYIEILLQKWKCTHALHINKNLVVIQMSYGTIRYDHFHTLYMTMDELEIDTNN